MWNLCVICNSRLESPNVISKIFSQNRQSSRYLAPVLERSIESTEALFLYLDLNLGLMMCNNAIEHITGYTRKEMFKGNWLELIFHNNKSRKNIFKAVLSSCFSNIKGHAYEGSIVRKDGTERVLLWRNTVISNTAGKPWGLFCTAQDITEYKLIDNDSLACSERLRDILSSIKDYSLITTNLGDKITYYGKEASNIFRWQKEMTLENISIVFKEKERDRIINNIKSDIGKKGISEQELDLLRGDGDEFPANLTASALLNSKNKNIGYVYVVKDIGERKRIEKNMMQNEKMAAIGQLAAGVAHEINNPLLVISGRLDMLEMAGEKLEPESKKTFETIKAQAKRMRLITDRLLFYSRKKPVHMDTINLNDVLKTIHPLLAYYPEFQKIIWKEQLCPDLPGINGDFNQLQELFLNLSLNACQAMPEGGTIIIGSTKTKDNMVQVSVKDTGIGIAKESLNKLFLPFFTTKDNGTGLGLALCHSIVEAHRGSISADSIPGAGTVFTVGFPVQEEYIAGNNSR
jgi:PAS domain S-box-containing protein